MPPTTRASGHAKSAARYAPAMRKRALMPNIFYIYYAYLIGDGFDASRDDAIRHYAAAVRHNTSFHAITVARAASLIFLDDAHFAADALCAPMRYHFLCAPERFLKEARVIEPDI